MLDGNGAFRKFLASYKQRSGKWLNSSTLLCNTLFRKKYFRSMLLCYLNSKHPDKKDEDVKLFERKINFVNKETATFT